jgi:hypothetical protein
MRCDLQFFFVFVVWGMLYCLWTFTTLLALNVRAATRGKKNVDAQHIVVIAMYVPLRPPSTQESYGDRSAGMFSIFTSAMLTTHISLISLNQTTVEHISVRAMKDREAARLDEMHSFCALSCVHLPFLFPFGTHANRAWLDGGVGQNAAHERTGMPSGVVLGAKATSGGLGTLARTGNRSLVHESGHGSVSALYVSISHN